MCDICEHYFCRLDVAKYHIKNQHPRIEETTRSAYITAKAKEAFNSKQFANISTFNRCKTRIHYGPKPPTNMDIQNSSNIVTIKTLDINLPTLTSHKNTNLKTIKTLEPEININEDLFISSDSDSSSKTGSLQHSLATAGITHL